MRRNSKSLFAVALLVVLAVGFGLAGTVAPPLAESAAPQQESSSSSSSSSVAHFTNPPTYDSGWVDFRDKSGQYFNITHSLNTTEVLVDVMGKQSLSGTAKEHQRNLGGTVLSGWRRTYGGASGEFAYSLIQTGDGGYAFAGGSSSGAWLVKTDSDGYILLTKPWVIHNHIPCEALIL